MSEEKKQQIRVTTEEAFHGVAVALEKVSLRIDQVERRWLPVDLATDQEVDVKRNVVLLQRGAVEVRYPANLIANYTGGVVHSRRLSETLAEVEITAEERDHRLCQR